MEKHGSFSALWKAFYSQSLYRDVRQNWGFKTALYLFWVIVISTIIAMAHDLSDFKEIYKDVLVPVGQQFPNMTLSQEGELSIDKPSPYTIYFKDDTHKRVPFIIFDLNNSIKDPNSTDAVIIFHKNGYLIKQYHSTHAEVSTNNGHTKIKASEAVVDGYNWQNFKKLNRNYTFTTHDAMQLIKYVSIYGPVLFFLFFIVVSYLFRLIQALFYALLILIFGACYRLPLSYGEAYRLALVAVGPSVFIVTVLALAIPHVFEHRWLVAFVIQIAYMLFATYSNRNINQQAG